jgi:multiple sugar transport system ATP-binding protein
MSKEEMDKRVKQSLAEVKMSGYEDRYPREMSGGQQQRIALARMLAYSPRVFLMDEPLSNLDARLRMDMRTEIKRLHHVSGATTVYVTHDQVEAMTMSTNIAIMKDGVIQQMATPDIIYHFPANLFIADFIGNPKVNLLSGYISDKNVVNVNGLRIPVRTFHHSGDVVLGIRPEDVSISLESNPNALEFSAYSVMPSGAETTIIARKGDTEVTIREMGVSKLQMDQPIWLTFHEECINLYDSVSGNLVSS